MPQRLPGLKVTRLSIRASGHDKTLLAQAARARHVPVSRFVLQASLEAARAVLTEPTEFRLLPEQWETFCRRLDAPPQSIPALSRLFAEPEPFDA